MMRRSKVYALEQVVLSFNVYPYINRVVYLDLHGFCLQAVIIHLFCVIQCIHLNRHVAQASLLQFT